MFRTFVTYKFADGMIAERSFPEGTACLVQLDIPVLSLIRVLKWEEL